MDQAEWVHFRPSPTDFDNFVPWACNQMAVEYRVLITKTAMSEYVSVATSDRTKVKAKKSKTPSPVESETNDSSDHYNIPSLGGSDSSETVHIHTVYNQAMNLVQIKFLKNREIPREVIKIIALIIPFFKHLISITVNSGLSMGTIYEISKLLPISAITELILDNNNVIEANYHILLDHGTLKYLSLAKCSLNDDAIKLIAAKMIHTHPAGTTLSVLNLATNSITDDGVKYLAEALRSNRRLSYLNLSDNLITDTGANYIFDILIEFPLTNKENVDKKARHLVYLKRKLAVVLSAIQDLRIIENEKQKTTRRKSIKPLSSATKRRPLKELSNAGHPLKSAANLEVALHEKAEAIAEELLGTFNDPFDHDNTVIRDDRIFCHGNNTLSYLNISYNNLTFISAKKLLRVVTIQKQLCRKPRGLVNVRIEGNSLPARCYELDCVDDILESNFSTARKLSGLKKKTSAKSTPSKGH